MSKAMRRTWRAYSNATTTTAAALPNHRCISTSNLPRVAQPSLWRSLVPKPLRRDGVQSKEHKPRFANLRSWARNPVTPVFCLALMIGSQAIQHLTLKNEMRLYSRKTDAKIALLKNVIERVQQGENVDVERVLGTGDPKQEQEWWDVMKEIESEEEALKKARAQRERTRLLKQGRRAEVEATEAAAAAQDRGIEDSREQVKIVPAESAVAHPPRSKPVFF